MGNSVFSPEPGGGAAVAAISPAEAKQFFEFFKVGARKEILLLGEAVEIRTHWAKGKGFKVLCTADAGACAACDRAGTDPDVGVWTREYHVPAYVRPLRERQFLQRVCVFPAGGYHDGLIEECPDGLRGKRLVVVRGASNRLEFTLKGGIPAGFPALLAAPFDVHAFNRARYGLRPLPQHCLIFLPPIRVETDHGPAGRAERLTLTREDCAPSITPDEAERLLPLYRERGMARSAAQCEEVLRTASRPIPTAPAVAPPAAVVSPAVDADGVAADRPKLPKDLHIVDPPGERTSHAKIEQLRGGTADQVGPRHVVRPAVTPADEDETLTRSTGETACGEVAEKLRRERAKQPADELPATPPTEAADLVAGVLSRATIPIRNGKHPGRGQKGGGR